MPPTSVERVPPDWPNRVHSRSLRVGALDWHVQVAGSGPTLLLLHGTGASAHSWADLLPALSAVATVVAPDLPGHGFTTGAKPSDLTLPRIATELDALLGALQVAPPMLVAGHSAGAALALRWLLSTSGGTFVDPRDSRLPASVVGFAPSLVPPPAVYTKWLGPLITPLATAAPMASLLAGVGARTGLVDRLIASTGSALPPDKRALYARLFSNSTHVRGAMGFMAAADLPALLDDVKRVAVSASFVLGSRDAWIPERALRRVIAASLPQARVVAWNDGHLLHEVQAPRAAALLTDALARALDPAVPRPSERTGTDR